MRWLVSLALLGSVAGCGLDAGSPWGLVDPDLTVTFDPPAGRITAVGRLRTSLSYDLEIERLTLVLDAITARTTTSGVASVVFDPADPPPQYSLCHNGHCHHDDGRLVDYDDIAAEIATESNADSGLDVIQRLTAEPLVLLETDAALPRTASPVEGTCSDGCQLPRGDDTAITSVSVTVSAVELEATVFDTRVGSGLRIPGGVVAVRAVLPLSATVVTPVAWQGKVGRFRRVGIALPLEFATTHQLFDDVDFAAVLGSPPPWTEPVDISTVEVSSAVAARLSADSTLTATVSRFNP